MKTNQNIFIFIAL